MTVYERRRYLPLRDSSLFLYGETSMKKLKLLSFSVLVLGFVCLATSEGFGQPDPRNEFDKKGPGGKGGFGFGPPGGQTRKILKDFDKDKNGWLNAEERKEAREVAKSGGRGGKGGFGPPGGFGRGKQEPPKPGPKVKPNEVQNYPGKPLYDPNVLRTIFIDFENADWESEMEDFHGTDVEVPATVTVDGKKYPSVGFHFRGMSSYGGVSAGFKRSLNVSFDLADSKQRLYGAKTLNLLNAHEDASMLNPVLYSHIARNYIPAPKANMVKVVINGESWGLYCNVQQFDKVFLKENYKTEKGTRWKVSGNPGAQSGLEYTGDNVEDYKRKYEIKSGEDEKAWKALINFCKVLNKTPPDKLEEALKPIANIDNILWFLALDVALINCDGYWVRSSDYSIYLDEKGKFNLIPHDMNEAFRPAGGPGMGGGGPRMFAMAKPGEVLGPPLQDMLRMTEAQKKQLAELQKEVDAKLEKVMTEEQRAQFKQMRDAMANFGPPGGPGGPGGFPGGPGGPPGGPGGPPGGPGGFPGGPGGPGGGMGGGGLNLDPLVGLTSTRMPLRSKLFAVPSLKKKYLENVKKIAEDQLDWSKLGPTVASYRKLMEKEVAIDTRKLESTEGFMRATADTAEAGPPRGREISLRAFADARRKYLMDYKEPTR